MQTKTKTDDENENENEYPKTQKDRQSIADIRRSHRKSENIGKLVVT
jgi:hypothetical protein